MAQRMYRQTWKTLKQAACCPIAAEGPHRWTAHETPLAHRLWAEEVRATNLQLFQLSNELWAEDVNPGTKLQAEQAQGHHRCLDPIWQGHL